MGGKYDNKQGDLNWAHPFPRVWGCKKGSAIMEAKVYLQSVMVHSSWCGLNAWVADNDKENRLLIIDELVEFEKWLAGRSRLRAALHKESRPSKVGAVSTKILALMAPSSASSGHFNKSITGAKTLVCKGLGANESRPLYKDRER